VKKTKEVAGVVLIKGI